MSESFDVIVVGARCAGASLATILARAGLSVCLFDKAGFPSDTLSTHGIQPAGVRVLGRLGVLDQLLKLAPPIRRLRMTFDDAPPATADLEAAVGGPALSVRRLRLDDVLLAAAANAGVDVRTSNAVTGLVWDDGRVRGVSTATGKARARLVVGADGARSSVARFVGAPERHGTTNGRVFMWGYFDADPTDGEMWIAKLGDHTYLSMPTDGGLSVVAVCPSIERRAEVRADRDAVFDAGLRAWPKLHAGVEGSERQGPLRTMANLGGFFRSSAGAGWALVGDAGHFKDPTAGQGISDALRQSERLAQAIVNACDDADDTFDAAVRAWSRWRDEDAWEMYWFAHDMGAAGPTPSLFKEANRRITSDPALTVAMTRILNHELAPSEVFTPSFALATMTEAFRRARGQRRVLAKELFATATDEFRRWRASP